MLKTLAEVLYQVTITKPEYKEQTKTVNMSDPEMNNSYFNYAKHNIH